MFDGQLFQKGYFKELQFSLYKTNDSSTFYMYH